MELFRSVENSVHCLCHFLNLTLARWQFCREGTVDAPAAGSGSLRLRHVAKHPVPF